MSLLALHFENDRRSLDAAELAALQTELAGDRAAATELRCLLAVDALLHRAHAPDRDYFTKRVLAARRIQNSRAKFVKRVVRARRRQASRTPVLWWSAAAALLMVGLTAFALHWNQTALQRNQTALQRNQTPTVPWAHLEQVVGLVVDGSGRALVEGGSVAAGGQVQAHPGASVVIVLADASRLTISDGVLAAGDSAMAWQLQRGRVAVVASHKPPGTALTIQTPHATARVVGTRFVLTSDAIGTRLDVEEGLVAFHDGVVERQVAAGASTFAGPAPSATLAGIATADLALWLRADQALDLVAEGVQRWPAAAGGLPVATALAPEQRPRFAAQGLAGRPALMFDGVDDQLTLPAGFADLSRGFTVAVVYADRAAAQVDEVRLLSLSTATHGGAISVGLRATLLQTQALGSGDAEALAMVGAGPQHPELPHLLVMIARPDGTGEFRQDGVVTQRGVVRMPPVAERDMNSIGWSRWSAGRHFAGPLSELALVRRPLNEADVKALERELMARWGLGR